VDVEAVVGRAAGELAHAEDEFLLEVVGEVVLGSEEDYASLCDCLRVSTFERIDGMWPYS
jgi:hypothetical protein